MFYIQKNKDQILFFNEEVDGAIAIDDDFENRFLYVYDSATNRITKKINMPYIVEESEGNAIIVFETSMDLYLKVTYTNSSYTTSAVGFVYAEDGIGKLKLDLAVNGVIQIELLSELYSIVPVIIEVDDKIKDDPQPSIHLFGNTVTVAPHPYYKFIQELQKEINMLKGE